MNLSELIANCRDDRSYRRLAADGGGLVTGQWIQHVEQETPTRMSRDTIFALAKALHVPEGLVVSCWLESMGIPYYMGLLDDPRLTDAQVLAITRLAITLAQENGELRRGAE